MIDPYRTIDLGGCGYVRASEIVAVTKCDDGTGYECCVFTRTGLIVRGTRVWLQVSYDWHKWMEALSAPVASGGEAK